MTPLGMVVTEFAKFPVVVAVCFAGPRALTEDLVLALQAMLYYRV